MIKLLTLKAISPYAEDTVYKICLTLDSYGLAEDRDYENYEELTNGAIASLEKGEQIIIAAETSSYNQLKDTLLSQLMIERNDGAVHSTDDGLYEGFTCKALSGTVTFMPLDFTRIDSILESFISYTETGSTGREEEPAEEMPDFDFGKNVRRMVNCLSENEQRVALVTGEATMWIYNLYNEIPSLTKVASFVEILDEEVSEDEEAASQSESVKLVGKARDAMLNAGCNFGAAISDIHTAEDEEGNTVYFTYVAVVDKGVAKAKKLSTSNPDDLELLLPNAVTLLCDTVGQRAELLSSPKEDDEEESETEAQATDKKKLPKNMVIFGAAILLIAIIIPLAVLINLMGDDTPTTALPPLGTQPSVSQTAPTGSTTTDPFGASSTTMPTQPGGVTQSTAVDVSAPETTAPAIPSTRGLFTFYVFGYASYYEPNLKKPIPLNFVIFPEKQFAVFVISEYDRYFVASTDPNADLNVLLDLCKEQVMSSHGLEDSEA